MHISTTCYRHVENDPKFDSRVYAQHDQGLKIQGILRPNLPGKFVVLQNGWAVRVASASPTPPRVATSAPKNMVKGGTQTSGDNMSASGLPSTCRVLIRPVRPLFMTSCYRVHKLQRTLTRSPGVHLHSICTYRLGASVFAEFVKTA